MATPRIREFLDRNGNLECWNCMRVLYKYDHKMYPRITLRAFVPLSANVPDPEGHPDCPFCKVNLLEDGRGKK